MKLHTKFLKVPGEKAAQFVECLDHMKGDGTSSSLLNYTKEWVDKVNRGGLFEVPDETFALFVAIELTMRNKLTECLKKVLVDCLNQWQQNPILLTLYVQVLMFNCIGT